MLLLRAASNGCDVGKCVGLVMVSYGFFVRERFDWGVLGRVMAWL